MLYKIADNNFVFFIDERGMLQGKYEFYDPTNGTLLSRSMFVDNKKHGPSEEYFQNGVIMRRLTFANGVAHGDFTQYFTNGQVRASGSYNNGKKSGTWIMHDVFSGKVSCHANYQDDKLHGEFRNYYFDKIGSEKKYPQCVGGLTYESAGSLREIRHYDGGDLHGDYIKYCANGRCYRTCMFHRGNKIKVDPRKLSPQDRVYVMLSGRPPVKRL